MGAPVGRVIRPGEVAGQEDGTTAVVMDYVGCARTVEDTPVDGSLRNVWVHGTAGQRKVPRSKGASVRSSTCVWAYGTRYGWLYGGTRICLGRRIVRSKQGVGRFLEYANSGSNCGVAGWKISILQSSGLMRGTAFVILCLDWIGTWFIFVGMQTVGAQGTLSVISSCLKNRMVLGMWEISLFGRRIRDWKSATGGSPDLRSTNLQVGVLWNCWFVGFVFSSHLPYTKWKPSKPLRP